MLSKQVKSQNQAPCCYPRTVKQILSFNAWSAMRSYRISHPSFWMVSSEVIWWKVIHDCQWEENMERNTEFVVSTVPIDGLALSVQRHLQNQLWSLKILICHSVPMADQSWTYAGDIIIHGAASQGNMMLLQTFLGHDSRALFENCAIQQLKCFSNSVIWHQ